MDVQDDRQKQALVQVDLLQLQLQGLKVFREMRRDFQDFVSEAESQMNEIKEHVTDQEQQTRNLIRDLDLGEQQRRNVDRVLESLAFDTMNTRQEEIHDAYSNTFKWIFHPDPKAVRPWIDFVKWLKAGERIYWINGKAGSGKSTVRLAPRH